MPVFLAKTYRLAAQGLFGDRDDPIGHSLDDAFTFSGHFQALETQIIPAMAGGLESLDVFIDLGAGEASEPELLFEGTAREVGLRFPEGVNVVIAAALTGPGLDATHVRVMRPPRGSAGRSHPSSRAQRAASDPASDEAG